MSRTRRFFKELAGPHVLFAFAVGAMKGWHRTLHLGPLAREWNEVLPDWLFRAVVSAFVIGAAAAAGALLAKRLTGNTLVSACAGALLALLPRNPMFGLPWTPQLIILGDVAGCALGLFAAGVRFMPQPALMTARLLGLRELIALLALFAGGMVSPAILPMPVLILLADIAYSPVSVGDVFRRTGLLFPLHAAAVGAGYFMWARTLRLVPSPIHYAWFELTWVAAALGVAALLVVLSRGRIRQTLVVAFAFAVVWPVASAIPALVFPDWVFFPTTLSLFGVALLIPTILWRIAIAITQPRRAQHGEPPIPSVPALRDLVRGLRGSSAAAAGVSARAVDPAIGLASTVETAVASAVSATLEQIRLAFRGRHPTEAAGPPEQILWNRLLTASSGGVMPGERTGDALARWRAIHEQHLKPGLQGDALVVCAGATPWPLVAALAEAQRHVILVERGSKTARVARADLLPIRNVKVIRHDGRGLGAIADGAADAVIVLLEASRQMPADVVGLLRECRRVVHEGGVAIVGFADLSLPGSQEALAKGAPTDLFTVREAVDAIARLAGLRMRSVTAGVLPTVSLAWLERAP